MDKGYEVSYFLFNRKTTQTTKILPGEHLVFGGNRSRDPHTDRLKHYQSVYGGVPEVN